MTRFCREEALLIVRPETVDAGTGDTRSVLNTLHLVPPSSIQLSHRAEIEKLGYKLVAVVKEELGSKEFVEGWWKPDLPLYLDTEKVFYRLVGGGNVHVGSLEDLQDEGVKSHLESSQKLVEGNLIGEGRVGCLVCCGKTRCSVPASNITSSLSPGPQVMGGTVIIGKPGQVDFAYLEKKFGDFAAWEDVQAKLKPAA